MIPSITYVKIKIRQSTINHVHILWKVYTVYEVYKKLNRTIRVNDKSAYHRLYMYPDMNDNKAHDNVCVNWYATLGVLWQKPAGTIDLLVNRAMYFVSNNSSARTRCYRRRWSQHHCYLNESYQLFSEDGSNSSALAMELLQFCTKPSILCTSL